MSIPEHTQQYTWRNCLMVFVGIGVGIFVLAALLTLLIDNTCATAGRNWLPEYPGAQFQQENYSFLRVYGVGTTSRVFITDDDRLDVRRWYLDQDNSNALNGKGKGGATMRWQVAENDNRTSTITLTSECARELDLSPFGIGNGGTTRVE